MLPRRKESPYRKPRTPDDTFRPNVQLDPSRVTDKRNDPEILFWIGNWWYEGNKWIRDNFPRPVTQRQPAKRQRVIQPSKQRYADEANQPPRIGLPIPRATPQRRKL